MIQLFIKWFQLKGWKVINNLPPTIQKAVVIAAPHTSNWDFVYTMAALKLMKANTNYFIKKEWYKWPFTIVLKKTGGLPIDRSGGKNLVNQMVQELQNRNQLLVLLSAEGTRKKVAHWKSGFYHIAVQANVPLVLGFLDYKNKTAGFGKIIHLTGNVQQDMNEIKAFYADKTGKNPDSFDINTVRLKQQ